jgi:hypothetical protein
MGDDGSPMIRFLFFVPFVVLVIYAWLLIRCLNSGPCLEVLVTYCA